MKKRQLIIQVFLIGLVFALFALLRFYNLDKRIIFDWDQEYLSNFLKKIIINRDLILIGHRATDDLGFFFGPYFEYFFVPFYLISRMDPVGLIYAIYFVNIVFFTGTYFILKKIFRFQIALFFLFLWSINYLLVTYDTTVWAPLFIPFGIILTWFFLWQIYQKNSVKDYLLLGLTLGFFTQIHSLFFPVDIFAVIFLIAKFVFEKNHYPFKIKNIVFLIIGFSVFLLPLMLFDVKHNFLNSKLFIGYFLNRTQGKPMILSSIEVYGNFLKPLLLLNNVFLTLSFHFLILLLFIYLIKKRKGFLKIFYIAGISFWLITTFTYLRYSQRPSEYYFIYLYPVIFIALADFIFSVNKYLFIPFGLWLIIINYQQLFLQMKFNNLGLAAKKQVVLALKKHVQNKKYYLSYDMPLGLNTGYDYLLEHFEIKPSTDPKDPRVIIRFPAKKNDIKIGRIGIELSKKLF